MWSPTETSIRADKQGGVDLWWRVDQAAGVSLSVDVGFFEPCSDSSM